MLYVHHVPGRLRVKVCHLKGDREAGLRVCQHVRVLAGVNEAVSNPATGSIIVHYDRRRVSIVEIWQAIYRAGVVDAPAPSIQDYERPMVSRNEPSTAEKLFDQLVGVVVEKAMEHSARVLIAALV
jgi:Heavy metal associated domain 2